MSPTGTSSSCPVVPAQIGHDLPLDRERRVLAGCLSSSTSRAPRSSCALGGLVEVGAERRERLELAVLRQVEPQRPATALHRLGLGVAADPGHRDTDVDGRPDAGVEQVGLEEDLAVGDRDHVGRDVGRDVVALGLDDRQAGHRAAAELVGELGAPLEQPGVQVEDVAGVGLAARRAAQQQRDRRGTPRPAWSGRRTRSATCLPLYIQCWPIAEPVYGRDVLEAGRVRRRRGDDRGVLHRAGLFERLRGPAAIVEPFWPIAT